MTILLIILSFFKKKCFNFNFYIDSEKDSCQGTLSRKTINNQNHTQKDGQRDGPTINNSSDKDYGEDMGKGSCSNEKRDLKELTLVRRRLKDLEWPTISEDQLMVFYDPLRRDEIKPIRKHEWETIATSSELRHLLSTSPHLRTLMTSIISTKTKNLSEVYKYPREINDRRSEDYRRQQGIGRGREEVLAVQKLIGFNDNHPSNQTRNPINFRGRGTDEDGYFKDFTSDEVLSFNKFFEIIRGTLEESRK
ncbi:hypothetical protein BY996DRAFT_6417103 [Phakopsora pachyrhizi]|nr:hypothetical protein BY996DRAFT_6417103 [Phakopsora pachyrhizi]